MALIDEGFNNINNNLDNYHYDKNNYPDEEYYVEGEYTLIVRRNQMNVNCGYIVLPKFHQYDGIHYNNIPVEVHGGLTYSQYENGNWVIGFDTCHVGDYIPYHDYDKNYYYWTHTDVINELKRLMSQLC
jgi:hypothetical protein